MLVNLARPYSSTTSKPRSGFLPKPARWEGAVFYAPEQPDFLFSRGDEVVIWMQSINRALRVDWALSRNLVKTPFLTGRCAGELDNSFRIVLPTAGLIPAFYDLRVTIRYSDQESLEGSTTFGWKGTEEPLHPVVPADFLPYWQAVKARVDGTPLDLRVTLVRTLKGDEIGHYNVASADLPEHYDPEGEKHQEIEIYKADWQSANGQRSHGWFTKPVGPGPFPAILVLPGAGNNPRPAPVEHARHGYATLDMNVHNGPAELPGDYAQVNYDVPFTTPDAYWGHGVYANALQGVNALTQLPGVDAGRLAILGGSQGGRASVVVAGLDPRIKAAVFGIAHFGNMPWTRWVERLNAAQDAGFRPFSDAEIVRDDQSRVESYYDVMNFAPLVRCPVLMNAGLTDGASPPTGVFAIHRSLRCEKEIVPLPNISHDWSPGFDRHAWKWLDARLNGPAK